MQFNAGGSSNPLLPPTPPPTTNGEEICRDFLKVYTISYSLCRNIWPFLQQGACFRENCKYSHAHAEGLCAQLPQVRQVFCWRKFGVNEPNFEPTFERLCISFLSFSFFFFTQSNSPADVTLYCSTPLTFDQTDVAAHMQRLPKREVF